MLQFFLLQTPVFTMFAKDDETQGELYLNGESTWTVYGSEFRGERNLIDISNNGKERIVNIHGNLQKSIRIHNVVHEVLIVLWNKYRICRVSLFTPPVNIKNLFIYFIIVVVSIWFQRLLRTLWCVDIIWTWRSSTTPTQQLWCSLKVTCTLFSASINYSLFLLLKHFSCQSCSNLSTHSIMLIRKPSWWDTSALKIG